MAKYNFNKNDIVGDYNIIYIKNVPSINNSIHKRALFKCHCGKEWESFITNIISNVTKSCGCITKNRLITHGLTTHPLYIKHHSMMSRCFNSESKPYLRYGGRGIIVSDELKNLQNYITYIESLPNAYGKGLSIDRINNNGNYEKGNLRWVTKVTQAFNRERSNTYVGVSKTNLNYIAYVTFNNKTFYLGKHLTPEQAVKARNKFIIENNLPHKIQQIKYEK